MRKLALIGGIGYIIIFITGIYANFNVLEPLRSQDMVQTYHNLKEAKALFNSSIISFVFMVIADLVLTVVLFIMFRLDDPIRNSIAALFRFINVAFFTAALFYLFNVQSYLNLDVVNETDVAALVEQSLSVFDTIWLTGLIFFGIHLLLLSKVLCTSKKVHKSISGLLFIAGVGYVVDSCLQFYYTDYASIQHVSTIIVVIPGLIGELSLTFWLLFKGGKAKCFQKA